MSNFNLASLTARQKQLLIAGGLIGSVLVVSVVGVVMTDKADKKNAAPAVKPVVTNIATPGSQIDTKDVWMGRSSQDIRDLQDENKDLENKVKQLEEEFKQGNGGNGISPGGSERTSRVPDDLSTPIFGGGRTPFKYPLMPPEVAGMPGENNKVLEARKAFEAELTKEIGPKPSRGQNMPRVMPPPPGTTLAVARSGQGRVGSGIGPSTTPEVLPGIMTVSFNSGDGANLIPGGMVAGEKGGAAAVIPKARERTKDNYMPSGTFVRGILLSGLDAPTGAQAQQNPHPILIRLTDLSILPNRVRFDIKDCFVTAAGYGDLSSERAYIRGETLSCVLNNGKVIDQELKGWATGEDGKAGIRGRLVTKQGQVLAAALLAGVASGIGNAFQQTETTNSISPLGVTQTLNKDQVVNAGVAGGVSTSLEMLAKYYIKLAEQLFPVVEIDAGRQVEIIMSHGMFFGDDNQNATQAGDSLKTPTAVRELKSNISQMRYE
ncbi:MAG: TraB/TrbI/VirB10 family type IV secretion system protein [Sulfuricaulis sp.]